MAFREIIEPREETELPHQWIGRQITSGAKRFGQSIESRMREEAQQALEEGAIKQAPYAEAGQAITGLWNKLLGTQQNQPQEQLAPLQQRLQAAQAMNLQGQPSRFQVEPAKNWLEEAIQGSIAAAPESIMYGGGIRGLIPMAAGQTARAGIKGLGGGELVQTGGQLGTELLTGHLMQKGPKTIRGFISNEAEEARKTAPAHVDVGNELQDANKFADRSYRTTTSSEKKKDIMDIQKTVGKLTSGGKVDPLELWDLQKDMYDEFPFLSFKVRPVSTKYTQGIGKILENSGMDHPEFWNHVSSAKQAKAYNSMQTLTGWFFDNILGRLPVKGKIGRAIMKIGKTPIAWVERQLFEKPFALITQKYPKVNEYYVKRAVAAAQQNQGNFMKYSQLLVNAVDKAKEQESKEGRFKEVLD